MDLAPTLRNLGKGFVMPTSGQILAQHSIVVQPTPAHHHETQLGIEHGQRRRRMLNEQPQPRLALGQLALA